MRGSWSGSGVSPPAERWHRVWPVTSARRAVGQAGDPPAEWQPMMVRDECPHAALHRRVVRGRPRHVDWTDAAIIAATLRERQCDKPVMPWHHEPPWFHGGARRDRVRHDWLADGGRALLPCAAAAYGVAGGEVGRDGGGGGGRGSRHRPSKANLGAECCRKASALGWLSRRPCHPRCRVNDMLALMRTRPPRHRLKSGRAPPPPVGS